MSDLQATVAALTAFVVALTGLVPVVVALWKKVGRQGREFDEFYDAHLLRGKVEALQKGLATEWFDASSPGTPDSEEFMPLALRPHVHAMYDPIAFHLRRMREANPDTSRTQMAKMIERRFGGWLSRYVCLKLGVNQFACVEMAIAVADGIPPVPESKHD